MSKCSGTESEITSACYIKKTAHAERQSRNVLQHDGPPSWQRRESIKLETEDENLLENPKPEITLNHGCVFKELPFDSLIASKSSFKKKIIGDKIYGWIFLHFRSR